MAMSISSPPNQMRKFSIDNILTPPTAEHRNVCDSPASTSSSGDHHISKPMGSEVSLKVPTVPADAIYPGTEPIRGGQGVENHSPLGALGTLAQTLCTGGGFPNVNNLPAAMSHQQHLQQLIALHQQQQQQQHQQLFAPPQSFLNPATAALFMAASMQQQHQQQQMQLNRCSNTSPPPMLYPHPATHQTLPTSPQTHRSPNPSSTHHSHNHNHSQSCGGSNRKQRTVYHVWQIAVLERAFHKQQYMVGADREVLAQELALTETQVRIWFQNRRSKWRKDQRERKQFGQEIERKSVAVE